MSLPPHLVGRTGALAALDDALARATMHRGGLVLLTGEPGIGKSALADFVARQSEARGALVVRGRAWEFADAPPYFPLWACLRSLDIEPPRGVGVEADAFHLWERVLERLSQAAAERPITWILDDLHAADLQTLDLLTFLAQPLHTLAVLVVGTLRDEDLRITDRARGRFVRMGRDGHRIHLEPLGVDDVRALAASLSERDVPDALAARLTELTGGNPLFVVECARAYAAAGAAPFTLPASVRQLVHERCALLGDATFSALTCGAILGRDFAAAVVARMRDAMPAQIIEALFPAVRAGLVAETKPGQYRFSHILVRDAVEQDLDPGQRSHLHARAERALASSGDTVEVLVERSRHALVAMRPDGGAIALALTAAAVLENQGAFDRAWTVYKRIDEARIAGLPGPPGDPLRIAGVARAAGRHADARRLCLGEIDSARALGDGVRLGHAALELGALLRPAVVDRELIGALRDALAMLGPDQTLLRCRASARLAAALQPADDPQVPVAMARDAIAAARRTGDERTLLDVLHVAGAALVSYAPLAERLDNEAEISERAFALGDLPLQLAAQPRLALDHLEAGDFEAWDVAVDRARELSLELGHPRYRWRALFLESMRALARGDFAESDRAVVEIQQHASITDDPALMTALGSHQMTRALLFSRDDEARSKLELVSKWMADVPYGEQILAQIRLGIYACTEEREAAAAELARLLPHFAWHRASLPYYIAEACALAGTREQQQIARAYYEPLAGRQVTSGHISITYQGPVERLIGLLDAGLGDHAAACVRLGAALDEAIRQGHRAWTARISYELGRVHADAGHRAEAERLFADASRDAAALGMPGLLARVRARLGIDGAAGNAIATASPRLVREGDLWRIELGDRIVRVKDSRGMQLLAKLAERAGEEIHVLTLASDTGSTLVEGDTGAALDAQARREYKARIDRISAALDTAEHDADLGRRQGLLREKELLVAELGRATGLGGRSRPNASATERARVNVQRRLRDALARIAEADPALGRVLESGVRTGTYCCFRV